MSESPNSNGTSQDRDLVEKEELKSAVNSLNNLLLGLQGYISFMEANARAKNEDTTFIGPMVELVGRAAEVANGILGQVHGSRDGKTIASPPPFGETMRPGSFRSFSEALLSPPSSGGQGVSAAAAEADPNAIPPVPNGGKPMEGAPAIQTPTTTPIPPIPQEAIAASQQRTTPTVEQSQPSTLAAEAPSTQEEEAPPPPPGSVGGSSLPPAPPLDGGPGNDPLAPKKTALLIEPRSFTDAPEGSVQEVALDDVPELQNLDIVNREGTRGLVMIVDDEEHLLYIAARMLASEGYRVINCSEVFEALHVFESVGKHIDLVILDYSMPTMNGEDVFYEIMEINPKARVVLSSGLFEKEVVSRLLKKGLKAFLPKPYKRDSLLQTVTAAIEKSKK